MQDSVEMTKSVVNGGINTVLRSRVVQMESTVHSTAHTKSETLVDQYLPLTEAKLEEEAAKVEGFELGVQKPSYYVQLGSLSSKVCARAYQQALNKVRDAKQKSQETISQLHHTVNLIEYARKNVNSANQKLLNAQEKLCQSWAEWKKYTGQNDGDESHSAEVNRCKCKLEINGLHTVEVTLAN
nr:perilipin-2-like [Anser cygnoides]